MAFGFIKKVFSFGKKDEPAAELPPAAQSPAVEVQARPAAAPPLPDFLRPAAVDEVSDAVALTETPPDAIPTAPTVGPSAEPDAELTRPVAEVPAAPDVEATVDALQTAPTPRKAVVEPAPLPDTALAPSPVEESTLDVLPSSFAPDTAPAAVEPESTAADRSGAPELPPEQVAAPPVPEFLLREPVPPAAPVAPAPEPAAAAPHAPASPPVEAPPPPPALPEAPPPSPPLVRSEEYAPTAPPEPAPAPATLYGPAPAPAAKDGPAGKVVVGKVIAPKVDAPVPAGPTERKTWFHRLREGLSRSSRELTGGIAGIFTKRKLDEETLEELEEVLLRADLGMETAIRVTDALSASRYGKDVSDTEVRLIMAQEVEKVLRPVAIPLELDLSHKPHVILVVGVNGTGKTTTIGKLAAKLTAGGLSVMLAAGDTFRAAAIEQLKIWGERTGSPVVSSKIGADAAGLAWDAFEKARAAGSDVLIIDTAGRLQNRTELMAELEKIVRVLGKHDPEAPHTVLQTVDATTGQNALNQVEIFRNIAGVNGLVMTKLDGTARGGILVAIAAKHRLPVYFIGVGEQVDDLEPFSASDFAKAIAGVA